MWIRDDIKKLELIRPSGVTIGAFDGVHLGHQALIRGMVTGAHSRGLLPLVITFDPLPGQVLQPDSYRLLSALEERLTLFESLGVEGLIVLPFNSALTQTSAGDFVQGLLDHAKLGGLWVGPDFKLGRGQEGNVDYLRRAGQRFGFGVHVFEGTVRWEDKPVSSSRIRRALSEGNIHEANGCLGYPFHLRGKIVHGYKRGRALGFPTANLGVPSTRLLPANGVYISQAHLKSGTFDALTNVGTRPTFDNGTRTVEAYLLDFSEDIYGEPMRLDFLDRLRPERRFDSVDDLIHQMTEDEVTARRWLRQPDQSPRARHPVCPKAR